MKIIASNVLLFSIASIIESVASQSACSTACGSSSTNCLELVDDNLVVGCYGTWFGGTISSDALNLCGNGWHLCESANEAEVFGLTTSICANDVPIGHSFWTLESSLIDQQDGQCFSKYGYVSCCNRPRNDIWGCVNAQTSIPGCGPLEDTPCGVLNINCGDYSGADFGDSGLQLCDAFCDDSELFIMHALDSSKNGVLCCRDTIPDSNQNSQCDESITVWSLRQGFFQGTPNFAPHIGKYTYSGSNSNGYPRYVHGGGSGTGAEITVGSVDASTTDLVLKLIIPNYGTYYSPAMSFETGYVVNGGNNIFEIIDDYFSPWGTDTSMSTTNSDHLEWIANGATTLEMTATFNDCSSYGLNLVSEPSNNNNNGCSTYDHTVYNSCTSDTHCSDCQNWGCNACETGNYKMGNLKRCQSCDDTYNDCTQCSDWNGCVVCGNGKTLTWNGQCNDQTCQ